MSLLFAGECDGRRWIRKLGWGYRCLTPVQEKLVGPIPASLPVRNWGEFPSYAYRFALLGHHYLLDAVSHLEDSVP